MVEKHEYRDDNAENYTTELNIINRGYIKGKHKKVDCRICLKTMGSNNLKKLMRQHEKKQARMSQKVVIENHPTLDVVGLRNIVAKNSNEFMRKLELGRGIKRIITEDKLMKASLSVEHAEAMELFEKHVRNVI